MTRSHPAEAADRAGRGRPRNPQTHEAILTAARDLLRSAGYAHFSIERVASNAGVSKASIYRRWPTKGALLLDLYMAGIPGDVITPDAPNLREELHRYLMATIRRVNDDSWREILRSLVAEAQYDTTTSDLIKHKVIIPRREAGLRLLLSAQRRREIAPDCDHELVLDMLFGPLWYRLLFDHAPIDEDFAARLLSLVLSTLNTGTSRADATEPTSH
ncbi:TetR/AcrR family transcriptional regulator [Hydrogenophaga crocea]|uniref:TetR/AcrR family transcriptional regulator n=1 Tax=Hydrogenophaga crocea TaxID=2716225 RepID=A0A6G8ICK6_9BURK|nr:TetR/AcrR family transcriptional regulator [Hydrogenophaga crocea]QIM50740.1 TetR/AcrR family transcriptional regulator [Hydrogenophaga crocea]